MTFGITPTGFIAKTLEDIKAELEADYRGEFGNSINIAPQSIFGQMIGVQSESLADLWAATQAVAAQLSPDTAEGVNLDNLCALTGTVRKSATKTKVLATVTGTPATTIPPGTIFSITGTSTRFIVAAGTWVIPGGGTLPGVECVAEFSGVVPCYAGTLTTISTPVGGLASVTNPSDHYLLGTIEETDAELRIRRELEVRGGGAATVSAIEKAVAAVSGVLYVKVLQNDTDVTNALGMPPHSIRPLVRFVSPATTQKITDAIVVTKAAGIESNGTQVTSYPNGFGSTFNVGFSLVADVPTEASITLGVTEAFFANTVANTALVKQAVADYVSNLPVGYDVVWSQIIKTAANVPGVIDAKPVNIRKVGGLYSSSNIVIAYNERATMSTSNITVTVNLIAGDVP